jgi:hypothetical protein
LTRSSRSQRGMSIAAARSGDRLNWRQVLWARGGCRVDRQLYGNGGPCPRRMGSHPSVWRLRSKSHLSAPERPGYDRGCDGTRRDVTKGE